METSYREFVTSITTRLTNPYLFYSVLDSCLLQIKVYGLELALWCLSFGSSALNKTQYYSLVEHVL